MREILFRGKDNFGNWQYGVPVIYGGRTATMFDKVLVFGIAVEAETIGQYIGQKDKDEKNIYEGDIVKVEYSDTTVVGVIEYHSPSFFLATDFDLWEFDGYCSAKVLGNIHDNPELLKGGESE